ncbi:peroxisomal dehydratase [Russula earlei]|uniref:Peroxisomal dehydratase n=1 Tax=Russula earlei TaxID=71964 RepID=A0ACC0TXV6_9AGAM|nr:peroxisomal dehydratase [Russula earlei]
MTTSVEQLEKLVGQEYAVDPVSWNKKDLLIYAIGIGAKTSDKQLVYELGTSLPHLLPRLQCIQNSALRPVFCCLPNISSRPLPQRYGRVISAVPDSSTPFTGADQDVINFAERVGGNNTIKGLPKFDPSRIVHASQTIEVLKPLPLVSGPGWKLKKRLTSIGENKSGVIIESEFQLVDPDDTPYARLFSASFNLTGKITGKRFAYSVASPPQHESIPRDRAPDWIVRDRTLPEQALIYRLSGDYNPLHIDPRVGSDAGFGGVILHGLSTFGFAARAVIHAVGGGLPSALRYFGTRFTSPVVSGDELETSVWEVKKAPDGTSEVAFEVKILTTGKVVLGGGLARVVKSERPML